VKIGITLPQFRPTSDAALLAARLADDSGLDGVFVFDHVWAIGNPDRPALNAWPLLGALAAETTATSLGTLVARVSLLSNAVLAHNFESLHRMIGSRLIAGLGTGDELSKAENEAVGVEFPPVAARLADLADCCRRLRTLGIETWVGGRSPLVRSVAIAEADALNLWGVTPADVAAEQRIEVTWGGSSPQTGPETRVLIEQLRDAGATWAVLSPPYGRDDDPRAAVEMVAEAAKPLR
jgi:alkanesulfonate monooxygenase SsuD/methylene tetrahydromethanopterin reductase-like flavin-dependent oxidoreductase (luciferase family)